MLLYKVLASGGNKGEGFGVTALMVRPNTVDLVLLLGFYFWHYFFLENTVQRWYRIAEELREKRKNRI